jgi:hypothetical protein
VGRRYREHRALCFHLGPIYNPVLGRVSTLFCMDLKGVGIFKSLVNVMVGDVQKVFFSLIFLLSLDRYIIT